VYDIALIGSGGFLGAAIGRELEARGRTVVPFTRSTPLLADGRIASSAESVSVVVWAAGGISPTVAFERPDLVVDELTQFRLVMDALAASPHPPRVVLLSSGGTVYAAPALPPHSERERLNPSNAYGEYKLAEEVAVREAGLTGTAVRISNAYGPGQQGARGQGVLAVWMRAILAGEPIRIHGSGEVARDYVYIDDAAQAIASVVEREDAPSAVNVGSGHPTDLDHLLTTLTEVVGDHRMRVERLPSRGVDAASTWLDVTLARDELGWTSTTPLETGIRRMWQWVEGS
jgi:UDP-glucose 4-epimerase